MSEPFVEWRFYDSDAATTESRRHLPHIDMPGVLTFVTFRLADSMPKHIVEIWHNAIDEWLREHDLAGKSVADVLNSKSVSIELKRELRRFKNRKWHGHLDDCHGSCLLRDPANRKIVSDSLLHFNDDRYDIERFVIMPNHVHVLIQMRHEHLMRKQFRELQRYSARQINIRLNRIGDLWQGEPFDHIVRSPNQFEYLQNYVAENPSKARLGEDDYTLWITSSKSL